MPDETSSAASAAGRMNGCLELGRVAIAAGVRALLLPMPYFFPYAQQEPATVTAQRRGHTSTRHFTALHLPRFTHANRIGNGRSADRFHAQHSSASRTAADLARLPRRLELRACRNS